MSQINGYTKITSPDSNCLFYIMKTDGTPLANIDRYIEWDDLITAIQAAGFPPPVGVFKKQQPGEPTPAFLWSGTSWTNISEKAWRYELSVSGWVNRTDVHAWSETDYAATDPVVGGTYDGETVNTVFNPEGKFESMEGTRESGVTAKTFGEGYDADAMQRITGEIAHVDAGGDYGILRSDAGLSGVFSGEAQDRDNSMGGSSTNSTHDILFDSSTSISPNAAKTDDAETRPEYYSTRMWVRTA
jgi:hypothetical protein